MKVNFLDKMVYSFLVECDEVRRTLGLKDCAVLLVTGAALSCLAPLSLATTGAGCFAYLSNRLKRPTAPTQESGHLPDRTIIRIIAELFGLHWDLGVAGVCKHKRERSQPGSSYACREYAEDRVNRRVDFYVSTQLKQGFKIVNTPQTGDLVFYCHEPEKKWSCHVGVVREVDQRIIWVSSKWGREGIFKHPVEAVPYQYGKYVLYMRKIDRNEGDFSHQDLLEAEHFLRIKTHHNEDKAYQRSWRAVVDTLLRKDIY